MFFNVKEDKYCYYRKTQVNSWTYLSTFTKYLYCVTPHLCSVFCPLVPAAMNPTQAFDWMMTCHENLPPAAGPRKLFGGAKVAGSCSARLGPARSSSVRFGPARLGPLKCLNNMCVTSRSGDHSQMFQRRCSPRSLSRKNLLARAAALMFYPEGLWQNESITNTSANEQVQRN